MLLASLPAMAAPPIQVTVNGTPVNFSGTPPTEINGSVLVPLRGVFQALGASVNYNGATRTINAQKGSSQVILPLGATTATVNGQSQSLSQPAQSIGGTTLVPLRFVAQALGASVRWHAQSSTVEIRTDDSHLATLPSPPGTGPVRGQVTGVFTNTDPPQITLRVDGQNSAVPVNGNTLFLRSEAGQPGVQVGIDQLAPGDQVVVRRDSEGQAVSVTSTFGLIKGTVKSIGTLAGGDAAITLNDGTTVVMTQDSPITMAGRHVALSDIQAGEVVVIRTNPDNSRGYGLAVVTDNNQNPRPPGHAPGDASNPGDNGAAPSVTSFTVNTDRPLNASDTLIATLTGTPGGQASFSIPGVVPNVPMTETSSGVYTGKYRVAPGLSVEGAAVLGRLANGGHQAPLIQAGRTITIDSQPPKLSDLSPAPGASIESALPLIYGTISDSGMGIDPAKTRILLDSHPITGNATITPAFFNVNPPQPLAPGAHAVQVVIVDRAGNEKKTDWQFTVVFSKLVDDFSNDAPSGPSVPAGTALNFTMHAQPGGHGTLSIGNLAKDIPFRETSPGVYKAAYRVADGDNVQDAPVTAKFAAADGTTVTTALKSGLTLSTGKPHAPQITSPSDGSQVGDTLTISGTSAPNATVRVTVDYVSRPLGGLLSLNGSAGSKEITADGSGKWSTNDFSASSNSLFGNRNTTYTITAITVAANGQESSPTSIKVTHN